jgi:anthranilate 1,2-dioxygenase large subunit
VTQVGGVTMDKRHRHKIMWSEANSDKDDVAHTAYADIGVRRDYLKLQEPDLVAFRPERNDQVGLAIVSVFPTLVLAQIGNSLATRQIRTRGTNDMRSFLPCSATKTTRPKCRRIGYVRPI